MGLGALEERGLCQGEEVRVDGGKEEGRGEVEGEREEWAIVGPSGNSGCIPAA